MSTDLTLLVWSAALALAQMFVAVIGVSLQVPMATLVGNRDDMPAVTGWAGRAQRAHRNMLESLVLFAIVVLVAAVAGRANAATAMGATLFFWARLAYAIIYIAGIAWMRTVVWAVSIGGILLIMAQLL